MSDDDFKWNAENDDVIVHHQPAIGIYWNPMRQIVVRQEASPYDEEDPYIVLDVSVALKVVNRILLELGYDPVREKAAVAGLLPPPSGRAMAPPTTTTPRPKAKPEPGPLFGGKSEAA